MGAIKEENKDLKPFIMLNPKQAAYWNDEISGVELSYLVPNKYVVATPRDENCITIKKGLAVGKLIGLMKKGDADKVLAKNRVLRPIEKPDEETEDRLRQILANRDISTLTSTLRTIVDVKMLRWLLNIETLADNDVGITRHQVVDLLNDQIRVHQTKETLVVEKIKDDEDPQE